MSFKFMRNIEEKRAYKANQGRDDENRSVLCVQYISCRWSDSTMADPAHHGSVAMTIPTTYCNVLLCTQIIPLLPCPRLYSGVRDNVPRRRWLGEHYSPQIVITPSPFAGSLQRPPCAARCASCSGLGATLRGTPCGLRAIKGVPSIARAKSPILARAVPYRCTTS